MLLPRLTALALFTLCAACTPAIPHRAGADPVPIPSVTGDPWHRLVAEADSIGPETPLFAPSRWIACGSGVESPDSVQVSAESAEFLFAQRSLRTRGSFIYFDPPSTGAGRFALRHILCEHEQGLPRTFVLERNHRYFYLVFSLREYPSYAALTFRMPSGAWRPFRWDPDRHIAPKLKRGGQRGKRTAAGWGGAPLAQLCARKMPGPLSLAAHG